MYRYYFNDDKHIVYCVSHYAGKTIKCKAVCSANDKYDPLKGARLAKCRCDVLVGDKRYKRANEKYREALKQYYESKNYLRKMIKYVNDSSTELDNYRNTLNKVESEM